MAETSVQPVRLAVVGAGVMGRRHIAAAQSCAGVRLVAVVDSDIARAESAARDAGYESAASIEGLKTKIDAAVIAAPTAAHAAIAAPLLRAGIGCLVEKPLAASEAECRGLIAAAQAGHAVLQVGHIERFNPAVEALMQTGLTGISALAARRMSAASARVTDIDVISDLMVHDLDIVLALKKPPVTHVASAGSDDHAVALLTFADGTTATLTASRITAGRIRDLDVVTAGGFFHLDYIARSIAYTQRGQTESTSLPVTAHDALIAQLTDLAVCVRSRRAPRVSGEDALAALQITWRIQAALKAAR